ncbi:MAG: EcsC family protein [Planctomycetota bacterium]|nr:MAG: EcsC family protein [Planctomycetota bacterium]REJ87786.1 MAG: EcsC family protein [Planctomycetota bacterium]REK27870.1 MAG: EcsC family protein [Planctomycetota bacterium]REK32818.1 MAG: EcsC family protein [Planctomycetota bacterium]
MSQLTATELVTLENAVRQLETPRLASKLADAVGIPLTTLMGRLPDSVQKHVNGAAESALQKALNVALKTLNDEPADSPWNATHKIAVTLTGVAGGMFGAPALLAELPVTTTIMLRSIADIARSKGENLSDPAVRLACLEVFALGANGEDAPDDLVERAAEETEAEESLLRASYFATRAALAQQVTVAVRSLSKGGAVEGSSAIAKLISKLAARFGLAVSEKAAAQAVPIVGAIGGGLVNIVFMDHFQDTAEAHFSVRKLERLYGDAVVREEYERLAAAIIK